MTSISKTEGRLYKMTLNDEAISKMSLCMSWRVPHGEDLGNKPQDVIGLAAKDKLTKQDILNKLSYKIVGKSIVINMEKFNQSNRILTDEYLDQYGITIQDMKDYFKRIGLGQEA